MCPHLTPDALYSIFYGFNQHDYGLFEPGTELSIKAFPDSSSIFTKWSGGIISTVNPVTIKMDKIKLVWVEFDKPRYSLTISTNGTGTGTVTTDPANGPFNSGTQVRITAVPTGGSIFAGWSGATLSKENSVNITMDTSKTVTAKFLANPSPSVPYAQYNCPVILAPGTY
jgi:hypothetical protein